MFLSIEKVFYFPYKFSENINDNIMIYHTLLFDWKNSCLFGWEIARCLFWSLCKPDFLINCDRFAKENTSYATRASATCCRCRCQVMQAKWDLDTDICQGARQWALSIPYPTIPTE